MVVVVLAVLVVVMPEPVTNLEQEDLLVMIPLSLHLKVILEQPTQIRLITGKVAVVVVLVKMVKQVLIQILLLVLGDLVDMVFNFLQHSKILYHRVL
jgi:hypothetical protein